MPSRAIIFGCSLKNKFERQFRNVILELEPSLLDRESVPYLDILSWLGYKLGQGNNLGPPRLMGSTWLSCHKSRIFPKAQFRSSLGGSGQSSRSFRNPLEALRKLLFWKIAKLRTKRGLEHLFLPQGALLWFCLSADRTYVQLAKKFYRLLLAFKHRGRNRRLFSWGLQSVFQARPFLPQLGVLFSL
ncbi:hypothetical protein CPB84DRAFT_1035234 [Gymnopilus junonius]|uniref:Uncharacterized protein n=1 Tax=Gymnopilus junonius TaxID=109634 RepID=A0A9P5NNU1_GYMJU|nr:hypothetical protein CPB84DRAFT_1035234 [Gymnopilus junonius]